MMRRMSGRTGIRGYSKMSDDEMLEIIAEQERLLRFDTVSADALSEIGKRIILAIRSKGAAAYVMIRVNGLEVFSEAMAGTSGNNRRWAERKANMAELNQKSSMRVAIENRKKGRVLADIGLPASDYALVGGAFPILLSSGLGIGSIAVSGMPSEEDHQTICSVLSGYLGVEAPSITA